jgi:SPOR domain
MKWFFFLLLAGNLGFAGFVYLREITPNPDAQLLSLQMNADQIVIVPPRPRPPPDPVAAPGAKKPVVCLEWGSFGKADFARASSALDALNLGERLRQADVSAPLSHWVYIPPLRDKARVEKKIAELKKLGVTEYYPITEPGPFLHAISLGVFRSEEGAKKYLATLREAGVRSAIMGEREQRVTQSAFLVASPTEAESARFLALKAEFSGTDLRTVECPPG